MVRDAEAHAEEDKNRKELAEARNMADTLAYQVEKQITELGEKITAADKSTLEAEVKAVRDTAQGEDAAAIRTATQNLQNTMMQISQRVYEAAAAAGEQPAGEQPGAAGGAQPGGGDDVIDAEYKEK
jgi:molecular chaperone DnaK